MRPQNFITQWLLSVEPWVEYRTRIDLLNQPESVFRAWKDWDFGQNKEPSAWLTLMVYGILKKIEKILPPPNSLNYCNL